MGSISACLLGISAPATLPTFDSSQLPTLVALTAQALAALSATPSSAPVFPSVTTTMTQAPAPTIEPVIGEPVFLPALVPPVFYAAETSTAIPGFITAELILPTPTKRGCPLQNAEIEFQMADLINTERLAAGLNALVWQPRLADAARKHSADMACNNYFSHTGLNFSSSGERLQAQGYVWKFYGENIAAGYRTPAQVIAAWLKSPSHKANILGKNFKEIGAGYAYFAESRYGHYWTLTLGAE